MQSLASPYQGHSAAGGLAEIGKVGRPWGCDKSYYSQPPAGYAEASEGKT